jgi:hypothetical protein
MPRKRRCGCCGPADGTTCFPSTTSLTATVSWWRLKDFNDAFYWPAVPPGFPAYTRTKTATFTTSSVNPTSFSLDISGSPLLFDTSILTGFWQQADLGGGGNATTGPQELLICDATSGMYYQYTLSQTVTGSPSSLYVVRFQLPIIVLSTSPWTGKVDTENPLLFESYRVQSSVRTETTASQGTANMSPQNQNVTPSLGQIGTPPFGIIVNSFTITE